MQNDNPTTKSTDFLPPKPGASSDGSQPVGVTAKPAVENTPMPADAAQPVATTVAPSAAVEPAPAAPAKAPAQNPNMPTSQHIIDLKNPSGSSSSKDFMVKRNPSPNPATRPAATMPAAEVASSTVASTELPSGPNATSAADADLKEAMVDTSTSAKTPTTNPMAGGKKKLPVWALVAIIVVVIAIVAVATFFILSSVSPV